MNRPVLAWLDAGISEDTHEVSVSAACTTYSRTIFDSGDDEDDERSRYGYDSKGCSGRDGWVQFDTESDAWYFGIWLHPKRLVSVTYAEGDEEIIVFTSVEAFAAHVEHLTSVYVETPCVVAFNLDTGERTEFYDDRLTGARVRELHQETA